MASDDGKNSDLVNDLPVDNGKSSGSGVRKKVVDKGKVKKKVVKKKGKKTSDVAKKKVVKGKKKNISVKSGIKKVSKGGSKRGRRGVSRGRGKKKNVDNVVEVEGNVNSDGVSVDVGVVGSGGDVEGQGDNYVYQYISSDDKATIHPLNINEGDVVGAPEVRGNDGGGVVDDVAPEAPVGGVGGNDGGGVGVVDDGEGQSGVDGGEDKNVFGVPDVVEGYDDSGVVGAPEVRGNDGGGVVDDVAPEAPVGGVGGNDGGGVDDVGVVGGAEDGGSVGGGDDVAPEAPVGGGGGNDGENFDDGGVEEKVHKNSWLDTIKENMDPSDLDGGQDLSEVGGVIEEDGDVIEDIQNNVESVVDRSVDDDKGENIEGGMIETLKNVYKDIRPFLPSFFSLRSCFSLIVLLVVLGGIYIGYVSGVYNSIFSLFGGGGHVVQNGLSVSDSVLMEDLGILNSLVVGSNNGGNFDFIPDSIKISNYFGELREPVLQGETGISAAIYFGELMDEQDKVNDFVDFVIYLHDLRSLYEVDVYDYLDSYVDRENALNEYLSKLNSSYDIGKKNYDAIKLFIDDLSQSYKSLTPDKTKLEKDFFDSLEKLEPKKSDNILKSFIDVGQKQIALKARVSALTKLTLYYVDALKKLKLRIDVVEKNKQALIKGIHVVDVPGSGVDLIIKSD